MTSRDFFLSALTISVAELSMTPTSLKEISARVVKTYSIPYTIEDLPKTVIDYMSSANCCVNPECKGEKLNEKSFHQWNIPEVVVCINFKLESEHRSVRAEKVR